MSAAPPSADLVFLWHHHQPDYRSARSGLALLPWVRLHATKDYLDMALHLERHPRVRAAFNFVPSLLDQIEDATRGGEDALFGLLAKPVAELTPAERDEVTWRATMAPRWAFERWPEYRRLCERTQRARRGNGQRAVPADRDVLALEVWFLLAWLDPMFLDRIEARSAIAAAGAFLPEHRDGLLALHAALLDEVLPAYRRLAARGQIELTESAYYHPILPLLVNVATARRARPELPLPAEPFAAPEDAHHQIEKALERHERAFGSRPRGMWPPEGGVSPEVAEIAAAAGVRWLASDEGVLWASLPPEARRRESLYRPWRLDTPRGPVAFFFRDHELSDRVGFVYQNWNPDQAVDDFLGRVRRIARDHGAAGAPVIAVILDGENCWEHYAEDGGPFLERLYSALEQAPDIRTRTPSDVIEDGRELPALPSLHSGSWINADFRIWIGHPEKNRAWELLARTRRTLVEHASDRAAGPEAWDSLAAAEGSDWFWWFGEDHYTADKAIFDRLFREHLQAAHERAGLPVPAWLQVPVASPRVRRAGDQTPLGFIHPTLDGRRTTYYEWHDAGRMRLGAGGSAMHRAAGLVSDLFYGFDAARLYVRLDFVAGRAPGADLDLALELLAPRPARVHVRGLHAGAHPVTWGGGPRDGEGVAGAACAIGSILELAVPFASLGLVEGEPVELLLQILSAGQPVETLPAETVLRFAVPDATFEAAMWSA